MTHSRLSLSNSPTFHRYLCCLNLFCVAACVKTGCYFVLSSSGPLQPTFAPPFYGLAMFFQCFQLQKCLFAETPLTLNLNSVLFKFISMFDWTSLRRTKYPASCEVWVCGAVISPSRATRGLIELRLCPHHPPGARHGAISPTCLQHASNMPRDHTCCIAALLHAINLSILSNAMLSMSI